VEVDINQKTRKTGGPFACASIKSQPQSRLQSDDIQRTSFAVHPRSLRQQLKESLVEFVDQLKAGRACPLGRR
jgi:hypothetical protein